jgi:polygalacturonase
LRRRDLIAAALAGLPAAGAKGDTGLRLVDARQSGATGDGRTFDTAAINQAIDTCHASGGGVVYLPPGVYLSGCVVLKSNVTLYLEAGATLLGSRNIADYKLQAGPPVKGDANQKHLVFARDAENVGLAGPGRLDGQGPAFWKPIGRLAPPPEDSWKDVATYDWLPVDRASPLVEFAGCRHVRIEDVRIENASGWTLRPVNCDHVVIRGIVIKNPVIGPNTDGIDPTGCQNVFISDCLIDTGDDCICLKSENPYGGDVRVTKNITITNCVLTCCCNGLKFGTATRGGFENVTFTNSVIFNNDVDLKARVISGIALEMVDGGWLEGITISNVRMQRVRTPIFIRRGNRKPRPDGTPGTLRGVMIDNVHATGSILTSSVTGLPGFDAEDVSLSNISIESEEGGKEEWIGLVPEKANSYPEARMFGRLPSFGFYCRHVNGLRMKNMEIRAAATEKRPAMLFDDVKSLDIDGFRTPTAPGAQPVMKLVQTRRAWIRGCSAPAGTKAFAEIQGNRTEHIVVSGCDLGGAESATVTAPDVPKGAVTCTGNV